MVLSVVTLGQALFLTQRHAHAQTPAQCSTGSYVSVGSSTAGTSTSVNGPSQVALNVSPTLAPNVKTVTFYLDNEQQVLGRGIQSASNPFWQMTWYSQVSPVGVHTVGAIISLTSGSCAVTPVSVQVMAQPTGALNVASLPNAFEGYTNEPRSFALKTGVSGTAAADVTQWTVYQYSTANNLGVVTADADSGFRFSAGTIPGTGSINVIAKYGGISRPMVIPVTIKASTTTAQSAGPTTVAGTNSGATAPAPNPTKPSPGTPDKTATTAVVENVLPTDLKGDDTVKSCVVTKVTQQRYDLIVSGKERPTAQEFDAFQICFASRNYVLPVGWVPVEPKKETVKAQPTSDNVTVAKAQTVTNEVNGDKKQALKFSGKGKPNAKILLYIFSEPLVVSTDTNANGEWSYSLVDPMEPGKHEAYAMVNKGDGTYERSSVFNFAIAKAEAQAANPNGLSLNLEGNQPTAAKDNSPLIMYVVGVLVFIVLGFGILWWIVKHRKAGAAIYGGGGLAPETTASVTTPESKPSEVITTPAESGSAVTSAPVVNDVTPPSSTQPSDDKEA